MTTVLDIVKEINLIDIGSSGSLSTQWNPIEKKINLVGFDPNEEECRRLSNIPNQFLSTKYLPYAIAGKTGTEQLIKTKSIYCYSLLEPNQKWLERFEFADLFEVKGYEEVFVKTLDDVAELAQVDIDAMKLDTQGLELPILSNAKKQIQQAFCVETETGFLENYFEETTYAQIDEFMRANHFLLFDINKNRVSRKTATPVPNDTMSQLLWCEALWLKDYPKLISQNMHKAHNIDRGKILKAVLLCALYKAYDFAYEIVNTAFQNRLITSEDKNQLVEWDFLNIHKSKSLEKSPRENHTQVLKKNIIVNSLLRLLPYKMRAFIAHEASIATREKHLLKG